MGKTQSKIENGKSTIASPPRADLVFVSIKDIEVKDNVRRSMDEDNLFQLAGSMKAVGLLEPVIVCKAGSGKFRMIAGHRRLAAALRNDDDLIEAKVYDTLDDAMVARMQLTENLQREDLNHIDIARQLGVARNAGMTNAQIAAEINTSDDYVRKHLDLLRLTDPVAELVASGRLPVKQAELIARVGDPKQQIDLAGQATQLEWYPNREAWNQPMGITGVIETNGDYVKPMDELRSSVGYVMQGLGACGWPMGEEFAGKRPCADCPDNTATYADQPFLFAGIEPRGSAKKGHCTNEACYKAKTVAQNIVRKKRRKEAEKKTKAKIDKAKKAGLAVCEACTKVSDETKDLTEFQGQKLCAKCFDKAKQRAASVGSGAETYQQRKKRVKAIKKKFPWNAEQKFAVALHKYGTELANAIGESIKDTPASGVKEIILLGVVLAEGRFWLDREDFELMPTLEKLISGGEFTAEVLSILWNKSHIAEENQPCVNYAGKVESVPLPVDQVNYIDSLEALAKHWNVEELPTRPMDEQSTQICKIDALLEKIRKGTKAEVSAEVRACKDVEILDGVFNMAPTKMAKWKKEILVGWTNELQGDIAHAELVEVILKGKKPEALAAITACEDLEILHMIAANKLVKWKRKSIEDRIGRLQGDSALPPSMPQRATKEKAKAKVRKTKPKPRAAGKPSRVNKNGVLIDTERIEVKVSGSKRFKLVAEVALAPDGLWRRSISAFYNHAQSGFGYGYSPSVQTQGYESRREAIVAALNEIDGSLRDKSVKGFESSSVEADVTKALAAVESRQADFAETGEVSPASDKATADEQLGHIDKHTPLGREFEVAMPDSYNGGITLVKWTAKEYTFMFLKVGRVSRMPRQLWENTWAPNCTGYTDAKKDSYTIIHGKKAEALKAIATSADLKGLKMFVGFDNVLKGDWRRAAVRKRIEVLAATVPE